MGASALKVDAAALLAVFVLGAAPGSLPGQRGPETFPSQEISVPSGVNDLALAAVNALLGGGTAAVGRAVRGEPIHDAMAEGAVGGLVAYGGKRLAAEDFFGAGLLGRQASAVGTSVVRNATDGRPPFSRLEFPVGPVHLHTGGPRGWELRPDALDAINLGIHVARTDYRFLWGESLSAGALVVERTTGDSPGRLGEAAGGFIRIDRLPERQRRSTLAHERVHVLQDDFLDMAWFRRAERWALARAFGEESVALRVDWDVLASTVFTVGREVGGRSATWPLEVEAEYLERQRD